MCSVGKEGGPGLHCPQIRGSKRLGILVKNYISLLVKDDIGLLVKDDIGLLAKDDIGLLVKDDICLLSTYMKCPNTSSIIQLA